MFECSGCQRVIDFKAGGYIIEIPVSISNVQKEILKSDSLDLRY